MFYFILGKYIIPLCSFQGSPILLSIRCIFSEIPNGLHLKKLFGIFEWRFSIEILKISRDGDGCEG